MRTSIKPVSLSGITPDNLTALSREWRDPSWALELRKLALANYLALPWPNEKDERWRRAGLDQLDWKNLIVTGAFATASATEIPEEARERGVQWLSLEEAIQNEPQRIREAWSAAIDRAQKNKFLSLALALGNAGGCFIVPKGQVVKSPLHLPVKWTELTGAIFPLNFVFAEEAAEIHVWEELINPSTSTGATPFVASYTLVSLKENAKASCYYLQNWNERVWHFQFQEVLQAAFSRLNAIAVSMGGRVFHNETVVHLQGQGAENKVLGVNFGDAQQNFENWITQNHTGVKTVSDIQYRGALKGTAQSFFSGLVYIAKSAQQSDAYQSAKSLLLSKDARADAIPNLEILADDVKCSHGAAVGPVDEDQKFYLQSRGIPPAEAEEIIIQGFFEPVISEVPSPAVQDQLRAYIEEKLRRS